MTPPTEEEMRAYSAHLMLPEAEVRKEMLDVMAFNHRILSDLDHDSLAPAMLVLARSSADSEVEHHMYLLAIPFSERDEKHKAMEQLGAGYAEKRQFPLAVFLTSEAWASQQKKDGKFVEPRYDPERREVIICMAATLDNKHFSASMDVTRNAKNCFVPGEWSEIRASEQSPLLLSFYRGLYVALDKKLKESGT